MANILVLGANGFIGRHLAAKLAVNQENKITCFDRFGDYKLGDDHYFTQFENVSVTPGDFSNRIDIAGVLEDIDYVFHLISTTTPATSDKEPLIDVETNIKYSVELLEQCVQAGVKKVIYPSSGGTVYGDIDSDKIDELTLPQPRSPYAIAKLTVEHYLRYFKFNHGLDYIVYRIANPYGPGQNIYGKQGVVPIFMQKVLAGEPVTIYGDGAMVRDYFFIGDLVDMITGSFIRDNQHCEYNLGSGSGTSINDLVAMLESCTNTKIKRSYVEQPPSFVQKSVLDITRFTDEFNIQPATSIEEGLQRTWEYVKQIQ